MPLSAYDDIYKLHSRNINTKRVRVKPVLVVFSAIPGSGKTELSRRLADDYNFLRIANKDIREAVASTPKNLETDVGDYMLWLLDKLTRQNKYSIVFDRNIDQWYEPSKDWASKNGYKYILVRIDVRQGLLEQRLQRREKDNAAKVFEVLDFYAKQHEDIKIQLSPDVALNDNYDLDESARIISDL